MISIGGMVAVTAYNPALFLNTPHRVPNFLVAVVVLAHVVVVVSWK